MTGIRTPRPATPPLAGRTTPPEPALLPPVGWQAPLLDLLAAIVRSKAWIAACAGIAVVIGLGALLATPRYYRATAVTLLLAREKPTVDLAMRIGGVQTALAGAQRDAVGGLMLPPDTEMYTEVLRSRAVLIALAGRFDARLDAAYGGEDLEARLERLARMVAIDGTETGMLTIEVTCVDPALGADLANGLVAEMEQASRRIEGELLRQQKGFLDRAVARFERRSADVERELQRFLESHSVVDLDTQAGGVLRKIRELEMQKLGLERDLIERRASFTSDDPAVQSLEARVQKCKDDIARARSQYLGKVTEEEYAEVELTHETLRARVRFHRDLVATLRGQREIFEMRREQPTGSVAVLRAATPAQHPSGPRRSAFLGTALAIGLLLGLGVAMLREQSSLVRTDPYLCRRAAEIRAGLTPPRAVTRRVRALSQLVRSRRRGAREPVG